jgi:hypothetical protein
MSNVNYRREIRISLSCHLGYKARKIRPWQGWPTRLPHHSIRMPDRVSSRRLESRVPTMTEKGSTGFASVNLGPWRSGLEDPIGAFRHCSAAAGGCRWSEGAPANWSVVCRPVSCFVVGAGGKTGGIPSVGAMRAFRNLVFRHSRRIVYRMRYWRPLLRLTLPALYALAADRGSSVQPQAGWLSR